MTASGDPALEVVGARRLFEGGRGLAGVDLRLFAGEIYALLGFVRGRQGKDAEAIGLFREALRLDPAQWQAHLNLGIALERLGDLPGALAHYREALRLNPADGLARRRIDETLARQKVGGEFK